MDFRLNYHLGMGKGSAEPRYKPCQVLSDHQVPHAIWFEDALVHYGVPTVVFDLYILVPDIDLAADILAEAGWTFDMQKPYRIGNAEVDLVDFPQQRLASPEGETRTALLPATNWKFPLSSDTVLESESLENEPSYKVPFPPLAGLLDALIESWLDLPGNGSMLWIFLGYQISYLYAHVPALKESSFAEQMRYEHRQYHFDMLAGMASGTLPFRRHQRAIRDALLQGQYELRECSASRDNKELFYFLGKSVLEKEPVGEEQQNEDACGETIC